MSAWSNLPNAKHIDWVIESANTHHNLWYGAQGLGAGAGRRVAASRTTAWDAAYDAILDAAYDAILDAAYDAAYDAGRAAPHIAAQGVILALIACDDCDQYLSMTSEELQAWALLTEHPAAILLLPMVIVREQIEQLAAA
jgi:hypothetical protein